MKGFIVGLLIIGCFVLVGCSDNGSSSPVPSTLAMPSPTISIFKEYYVNYTIKDLSEPRCRWVNRDDDYSYGSFNLSREKFDINGEQTGVSTDYVGSVRIDYVKHYSRDENLFNYNSIDDYSLERFVDYCNYNGVLYMDAFVCQTSNNNSTSVCYNLSDECNLRLWLNIDGTKYVAEWMSYSLDTEIQKCIKNFDMVRGS